MSLSQAPITNKERTNLGPLTTTFIPAPSCTIPNINEASAAINAWEGQVCVTPSSSNGAFRNEDNKACWPPRSEGALTRTDGRPALSGWGFYSPGLVCPTGYSTACSATAGSFSNWDYQFEMVAGETAAGCCPYGYTCTNNKYAQRCFSVASSTSTIRISNCGSGTISTQLPCTIQGQDSVAAVVETISFYAPLIQLNWKPSDLATGSSTSTALPTSAASTDSSSLTEGPDPNNSGLSTGTKAGIGVGAALLGILTIATVAFLLLRRRNRGNANIAEVVEMPANSPPYELNAGKHGPYNEAELPHHTS